MKKNTLGGYSFLSALLRELTQELDALLGAAVAAEAAGDVEEANRLLVMAARKEQIIDGGVVYALNHLSAAG